MQPQIHFAKSLYGLLMALVLLTTLVPAARAEEGAPAGVGDHRPLESPSQAAVRRITNVGGGAPFETTRIYDRNGELLAEISDRGRRTIMPLGSMPEMLLAATIATEDKNFYIHTGVDWTAVARAAWQNFRADDIVSGASTITQQLVRTLLLDEAARYDLSLQRKSREAMLALELEDQYSKDEILEMYLNTVFYGHRSYGVVAAAQTYFNKDIEDLTLAESALIAGLPQSPIFYDPFVYPEAARTRQLTVLDLLHENGYITGAEKRDAMAQPIRLIPPERQETKAPHFVDFIRELLEERYGTEGLRHGLEVHTSLDLRYQELAERVAEAQISKIGSRYNASNAAVVIIHPSTGEVLAMVGGVDYHDASISGQVNMAVAQRQPGSSIKPVVYATAFNRGWSPASVIFDSPVSYRMPSGALYRPMNINFRYYGPVRLRTALSNSLNVSAVKLLAAVGINDVLATAEAMGIHSWRKPPQQYGLSLGVGGYELSLLELTHAFSTLANNGSFIPSHAIKEIRNSAGDILYEMPAKHPQQFAVSPAAAYQTSMVLSDARTRQMVFGRSSALNTSRIAAAKTGTTTGPRDNLTIGYTPYVAVGVWVGNSDNARLRGSYGSTTAAPIWHDIMEGIWADESLHDSLGYENQALPEGFPRPAGVYKTQVCELRSGIFSSACPLAYEEYLTDKIYTGRIAQKGENQNVRAGQQGFCLPMLPGDAPESVRRQAAFIPLPRGDDRAKAASWGFAKNLNMRPFRQCNPPSVKRRVAGQPKPASPKPLIKIPEAAQRPVLDEASGILLPGVHAKLQKGASTQPLRINPGSTSRTIGYVRRGQEVAIRKGPRKIEGAPWFEVRNISKGNIGWMRGTYLQPKEVAESGSVKKLAIGSRARLQPGMTSLYVRGKPGSGSRIVGAVYPKNVINVLGGPERRKGVPWYEINIKNSSVEGWVDGRYLIPRYY